MPTALSSSDFIRYACHHVIPIASSKFVSFFNHYIWVEDWAVSTRGLRHNLSSVSASGSPPGWTRLGLQLAPLEAVIMSLYMSFCSHGPSPKHQYVDFSIGTSSKVLCFSLQSLFSFCLLASIASLSQIFVKNGGLCSLVFACLNNPTTASDIALLPWL